MLMMLFAFSIKPNAIACSSLSSVCSCSGWGFSIYSNFCKSNTSKAGNLTAQARTTFAPPADFLSSNASVFLGGAVVMVSILSVFGVAELFARVNTLSGKVVDEARARQAVIMQNAAILRENEELREALEKEQLSDEQNEMIDNANKETLGHVDSGYEIHYEQLTFERMIGSGSFGDAFKGELAEEETGLTTASLFTRDVAIKRMRSAAIDEKGFKQFM